MGELHRLIEARWEARALCPLVFHFHGKRVKYINQQWDIACRAAGGLVGRVPHDLRRTAARNLLVAGYPETVVMKIGGWKTRSMFDRYAISDAGLIRNVGGAVAKQITSAR